MPRVAILQLDAVRAEVQDTLPRIEEALASAGRDGAALLVAPELATTGYGAGPALARLAETADGPMLSRLRAAVERTGVSLVTGFAERDGERVFNSAALLRPGAAPLVYRKAQLYGDYEQACFARAELAVVTAEVAGLRLGLLICFDVEFPEHVRRLAKAGCDLIAVPTALPGSPVSPTIAERVIPVRAFENQVFVAYAGWAGRDERFDYAGLSCLAGPGGEDLLRAGATGGFLGVAEVDPAASEPFRRINPYLAELREPSSQPKRVGR